jgi:hypothetical protein
MALAALVPIGEAQTADRSEISVSAKITEQTYCLGMPVSGVMVNAKMLPPDAITLRLMVRLSYRNVSSRPVIFFDYPQDAVVISKGINDSIQQENQTIIPIRGRAIGLEEALADRSNLEPERPGWPLYNSLPPGPSGVLEKTLDVRFQVHNPAEQAPGSEWLGKKLFVQLELNHANLPSETVRDLEVKWRPYGTFWSARVRTSPIELDIPGSPEVSKCAAEYKID